MKLTDILTELEKPADQHPASRRIALAKSAGIARKLLAATLPVGLGAVAFPARGAANSPEALNLLLEAKLILKSLYSQGADAGLATGASGMISATDVKRAITEITVRLNEQIDYLNTAVTNAGGTPVNPQTVFAAGTFTDRAVFMATAQVLHDTSSRAIKQLLPALEGNHENLMRAVEMQAADARYASLWRIARNAASAQFFPVEGSDYTQLPQDLTDFGLTNGVDIAQTVYQTEGNTQQAGTDTSIFSAAPIPEGAFDEPLAETEVRKVLNLFVQ